MGLEHDGMSHHQRAKKKVTVDVRPKGMSRPAIVNRGLPDLASHIARQYPSIDTTLLRTLDLSGDFSNTLRQLQARSLGAKTVFVTVEDWPSVRRRHQAAEIVRSTSEGRGRSVFPASLITTIPAEPSRSPNLPRR
jgi:hypothetical protein